MERRAPLARIPGQTGVVEGETGLYVPPGDAAALRAATEHLLGHLGEAERMGRAGRERVEEQLSLDHYVERLNQHVQAALQLPGS